MAQPTRVALARQGDLDALTHLINRSLQTQNVTAKLIRHDRCLKILLEGKQMPPQSIARTLQKGLERLGIAEIDRLEIYGKQKDANALSWTKSVTLEPLPESSPFSQFPTTQSQVTAAIGSKDIPAKESSAINASATNSSTKKIATKPCPRSYVMLALLTTVLAFLPLGIAALIFARQVKSQYQQQDYEGAKSSSETARILCIVGICLASPFYLAIGFLAASYSILTVAHEKQTDSVYELQAETTIEAVNRSQQAYWLENSRFAASENQLQLPLQSSDRYRYQMIATNPDRAIVTATAIKPGLKSFAGIVSAISPQTNRQSSEFVKTTPLRSAICMSDRPVELTGIRVEGDRIICPPTVQP